MAIIGPNGGGKTTLVKLILGLLTPDRGVVRVDRKPPHKASRCIGYVPQNVNVNRSFPITAMDVVLMGKLNQKKRLSRNSNTHRRDALAVLERLEVADYADRKIGMLSGGQRQRVFIARALVDRPRLLLLDEPTASIDTKGQADFYQLLGELNKEITILVVSHDLLVISRYVKSVACVNKRLHYHNQGEITGEMLETMYPCTAEEVCPVELMAHGLPHRVLQAHEKKSHG
jgi:zinc transport system ATP-binding protein